jgi:hypothetical protein
LPSLRRYRAASLRRLEEREQTLLMMQARHARIRIASHRRKRCRSAAAADG